MADILYTYKIRYTQTLQINATADAPSASEVTKTVSVMPRHSGTKKDPTLEEIKAAMDAFDFTGYDELVYCGYGEPTCALRHPSGIRKVCQRKIRCKNPH